MKVFSIPVLRQIDTNTTKIYKDNIKVNIHIDNLGYWKRLIKLGVVKGNPSYPFKPAEYKGSKINSKAVPADSPNIVVWNESWEQ